MAKGYARVLPSGRVVRWLAPTVPDYKRARDKLPQGFKLQDLASLLLPYVLTGITANPVPSIWLEQPETPPDPEPKDDEAEEVDDLDDADKEAARALVKALAPRYLDEKAMVASVEPADKGGSNAGGGWIELNYLALKKRDENKKTLLQKLFDDYVGDYFAMEQEIVNLILGTGGAGLHRPPGAPPTRI